MTCHVLSCVCSRSRSHTRRASLCDLALYPRFHAAALALSKHRETREGESDYYAGVMWHLVILKLPVKHPYVLPGVLPVNGADIYHPHHCNHQSSYPWTPNVWMNTLQFANPQWFWFVFVGVLYFNEYPLECVPWWLNMNIILQPPYGELMGICKVECNSGSWYNVFWWVCLHDVDADDGMCLAVCC